MRGNLDISHHKREAPNQPKLAEYPKTNGRRFSAKAYEKKPWVEYSIKEDAIYCFCCRHFSLTRNHGNTSDNVVFVDTGMNNWKKLFERIEKHEASEAHNEANRSWTKYKAIECGTSESIATTLYSNRKEAIAENRLHIVTLAKVACALARQGLPFRGHDEHDDSHNRGNFIEILEMMTEGNPDLQQKLKRRYGSYLSPDYQNSLISILADLLREQTRCSIKKYWAICADETKDLSKKEQLGLIIRFIDSNAIIREETFGSTHLEQLDAASLANAIKDLVEKHGLDWSTCVAQCYDGASVMSGACNGVQAILKGFAPQARYIHCHAHRLNLVLVQSIASCPEVRNFFSCIQALYVFLSRSAPRHELFLRTQQERGEKKIELERLADTRWCYWFSSIQKIRTRLGAILETLRVISDEANSTEDRSEASGLLATIDAKFLLILEIMSSILGSVDIASRQLQSKSLVLSGVNSLLQAVQQQVLELRSEERWFKMVEATKSLCKQHSIQIEKPRRSVAISRRLLDFYVETTVGARARNRTEEDRDIFQTYRSDILYFIVDRVTSELRQRFGENSSVIQGLEAFEPSSPKFLDARLIQDFVRDFPTLLVNELKFESEIALAKSYLQRMKPECPSKALAYLYMNKDAFAVISEAFEIALTLPVSTASNERFFSTLKRVKTYLRTTMTDERLSDLLVIATQPEKAKKIDYNIAVDKFASLKQRRFPLE